VYSVLSLVFAQTLLPVWSLREENKGRHTSGFRFLRSLRGVLPLVPRLGFLSGSLLAWCQLSPWSYTSRGFCPPDFFPAFMDGAFGRSALRFMGRDGLFSSGPAVYFAGAFLCEGLGWGIVSRSFTGYGSSLPCSQFHDRRVGLFLCPPHLLWQCTRIPQFFLYFPNWKEHHYVCLPCPRSSFCRAICAARGIRASLRGPPDGD